MNVGDKATERELKKAGYIMCPMPGRRDFQYWYSATEGYWVKVLDRKIVAKFNA